MAAALGLDDPVAAQAVEWMVLMRSGAASARDVADFECWRHADPKHDAACCRIERVLGGFASCASDNAARQALLKPVGRRRAVGTLLGLAGAGLVAGLGAGSELPGEWLADQRTGTGKRQQVALGDGGSLLLNARTAVDIRQRSGSTLLELISGEVMVSHALAGLVLRSPLGEVAAQDAEFAVRRTDQGLRIAVLRGVAALRPASGEATLLPAGKAAMLQRQGVTLLAGVSPQAETAWVEGLLQVSDRPLGEVVAALRDYRPGVIRIDDAAAALRVSGVFSLDDTDRSLQAIAQTLPVRVSTTSAWWVSIQAA